MSDHVVELRTAFRSGFGIPEGLVPDGCPLRRMGDSGLLLGSSAAASRLYLIQSDIDDFIREAPLGYLVVGFWGYGVNSYAFYYCRADVAS